MEGAIRSIWGIHIPLLIPYEQWGAVRSYSEFPNHLLVSEFNVFVL